MFSPVHRRLKFAIFSHVANFFTPTGSWCTLCPKLLITIPSVRNLLGGVISYEPIAFEDLHYVLVQGTPPQSLYFKIIGRQSRPAWVRLDQDRSRYPDETDDCRLATTSHREWANPSQRNFDEFIFSGKVRKNITIYKQSMKSLQAALDYYSASVVR